jgi:hypothetical protein
MKALHRLFHILPFFFLFSYSCSTTKPLPSYTSTLNSVESLPSVNDSTLLITAYSSNKKYGYTIKSPISLGVTFASDGHANISKFFNALAGPNGEPLKVTRIKSCCFFSTPNSKESNIGVLEVYEVAYDGLDTPKTLYFNFFDYGTPQVPIGFSLKKITHVETY